MELTSFTTNTIINYDSFLALRRQLPKQGDEQLIGRKVLEMAERILENLQKALIDSTISTAAGLEKESSFLTTHPALPNYRYNDISFGYDGSGSA